MIDHLELLDRLLETLPGQKSAPAPEFSVANPAEAANDKSPGDEGQGHHREDPVKQSLQSDSPCTSLELWTHMILIHYSHSIMSPSSDGSCLEY